MKKQFLSLFQKTYFYQHEGKDGTYALHGSGTITVWRWRSFDEAYNSALNAIVNKAFEQYPERDFNSWFVRFERVR